MNTDSMKRFPRVAAMLLTLVLLISAVLPVSAAEPEMKTVKVGFYEMNGYHMQDENGVRSGYGYEFLQLVGRYSNLRFEYVGYDKGWEEMQQLLQDGEIDILTAMQKTPEREEIYNFSSTLIGTSAAILTVKAGETRYKDGNYSGMRIGLVSGGSRNALVSEFMEKKGFSCELVYFDTQEALTIALQKGERIDAAMTNTLRRTENEWTIETLDSSPFYAVTRAEDTELIAIINNAIVLMDVDSAGWRTRLNNKYYTVNTDEVVAFTAEERAYIDAFNSNGRILRVTMNPDNAPYSYFESGTARGIIPDIFAEVAKRMGVSYEIIEPKDRTEYQRICMSGEVDIILDGMDDFYTIEQNGLEITDVYYTTPLAVLTYKKALTDVRTLAKPEVSTLNENFYSYIYDGKTVSEADYDSYAEIVSAVKNGKADGVYMPYYCAQWLTNDDVTGKLKCLMIPKFERSYVYAVSADENYELLSALNKAVTSLSDDQISAIVTADTEYQDKSLSFIGFVYKNIFLVSGLAILIVILIAAAVMFAGQSRRAKKELLRSRRMERYIGYLCDMYYKVLEVDFDLKIRKQYMKHDGKVEINESDNFTSFAIDRIHPDDKKEQLERFSEQAIRALGNSEKDECYLESRMMNENGEYRWYEFLLKRIPKDKQHPCSAMLLIKDVDALHKEREQNHEALVNALDAANTASRSKSTFLSGMSHEIRTPLNAMIGYMTIAQTSIDNKDKVIHCIDSAGVAAKHLLSIINDILDISSMESGKMKLAKDRFDLKEQLSAISTVFYQQCKQKNVKFDITVEGLTEEWVVGDPMRINQILMNLMSNAVKFTDAGGKVSLAVIQKNTTVNQVYIRFIVRDTGIGMSEKYLNRLFTPFEQESAQTARKYGGTGLGMSITFNLVSLMSGKIDVDSKQGEGTAFTVTLPFERTENASAMQESVRKNFSGIRVLVVDDLQNECDYIHTLLTRCGIRSETAGSGKDALRLVTARKNTPEKFDLCIIDWNMPELNGVETTRLIHDECDPDIPIIIATAYDISEFQDEALAAGAVKIISKPLFQSTLLDLLVTAYGKYDITPKAEDEVPDLTGMNVLLAEDNETNVEVAVDLLEIAGVTADIARNGKEALDLFLEKGERYNAILMDVQMPVMDGYTATKEIRASSHKLANSIPIIALTADAFAENIAAALASGMNDHIAKPIETDVLFSVLKRYYRQ